ncbi:MAG: Sua5/YciO/YrdC/YwlC family protein, partial [Bacteroidales bacterium]|nr:Sua5/YciO/YrdC/YwlC family protein [Bacteroidales bacterium]
MENEDLKYEIEEGVKALGRGEVILYPTDTIWGLGCDATDSDAVQRIYEI